MRSGASVSQLLAVISVPIGALMRRVLSRRGSLMSCCLFSIANLHFPLSRKGRREWCGLVAAVEGIAARGIEEEGNRHHLAAAPAPAMEGKARFFRRDIEQALLLAGWHYRFDGVLELID